MTGQFILGSQSTILCTSLDMTDPIMDSIHGKS